MTLTTGKQAAQRHIEGTSGNPVDQVNINNVKIYSSYLLVDFVT